MTRVVANLWHLKATNGMFHYALDYLAEFRSLEKILVRPALAGSLVGTRFVPLVCECSLGRYVLEMIRCAMRGWIIFVPTPHPFPCITGQVIVCHDSYPFMGWRGKIKKSLLRMGVRWSGAMVGHINHGDAMRLARNVAGSNNRIMYLPNRFPAGWLIAEPAAGSRLRVALFGSDSAKKNYEQLFSAVVAKSLNGQFSFLVYGHDTAYWRSLLADFPQLDLHLVESDGMGMADFLSCVHLVASAAEGEGFGRPIAFSLACGVPCYLIDCETFREFFVSAATLCSDVDELVRRMAVAANMGNVCRVPRAELGLEVNAAMLAGVRVIEGSRA